MPRDLRPGPGEVGALAARLDDLAEEYGLSTECVLDWLHVCRRNSLVVTEDLFRTCAGDLLGAREVLFDQLLADIAGDVTPERRAWLQ